MFSITACVLDNGVNGTYTVWNGSRIFKVNVKDLRDVSHARVHTEEVGFPDITMDDTQSSHIEVNVPEAVAATHEDKIPVVIHSDVAVANDKVKVVKRKRRKDNTDLTIRTGPFRVTSH